MLDGLERLSLAGLLLGCQVQPRLDAGVLLVEEREVGHEVLDDGHVRQRVDLHAAIRSHRGFDALRTESA